MSRYDCEQCEIRANKTPARISVLLAFNFEFEFIAEAQGGPDGTYIVARTPKFTAVEPGWIYTVKHAADDEPVDEKNNRQLLNLLVDHLVRIGWKPLSNSGGKWYSYGFERPLSLYIPDPEPSSMPYTIFDTQERLQKAIDLAERYQRKRDFTSCREAGKALMQYGVALERERKFFEAGPIYAEAKQCFESLSLPDEALRAAQARSRCAMLCVKFSMGEH